MKVIAVQDIEVLQRVRSAVEILSRYTKDELEATAHSYECSLMLVSIIQKTQVMMGNLDGIEQELVGQMDFGLTLLPDSEDDEE